MNYQADLILGKGLCIFNFFQSPDSGLSVLTGLHFYFGLRDRIGGNQLTFLKMALKSAIQLFVHFSYPLVLDNKKHILLKSSMN